MEARHKVMIIPHIAMVFNATFNNTVDSAYLQSLFVREKFAIKRTLR